MPAIANIRREYEELNKEFERASAWIESASPSMAEKHEEKYNELLRRAASAYNDLQTKIKEPEQRSLF